MGKAVALLRNACLAAMRGGRSLLRLAAFASLLGGASYAHAATFCSSFPLDPTGMFHVIDGNSPALTTATLPSSLGIDSNCYFQNFLVSAKWPNGLTSTINFKTTTPAALAVFTNVTYAGNMACSTTNAIVWFVNSTFIGNNQCQTLFIPVEAIGKASPGPTATIGVPFTYTMTIPVMYSAGVYTTQPSTNTLANATLYDDLTATGAALTYVSNTAYLKNGTTITPIGTMNLGATSATLTALGIATSDTTKHIVFSCDYNPSLCNIPAGTQVVIQMTVVLDNVPTNVAGTTFTNTAQWWFGRVINGVTYNPLPGQGGVASPMTIVEPNLTLVKSSPYTNLNVGTAAPFTLNVQNIGGATAWNTQVTDVLPTGMCTTYNPVPTVTAQVFASDGVTPVSPVLGPADYTVAFTGCQLTFTMLSAAAAIPPTDRLIITYNAELDAGTNPGLTFTNVAGASLWFSGPSTNLGRRQYSQTLTNGTPGVLDFQDAYTLTSSTQGYFFLKSVGDLTTGTAVATAAFPGDKLLYTFQIQNFTFPVLNNISVNDVFDALNATPSFAPGTLALVSSNLPAGTLTFNPTGGPNGTGSFSVTGLNLSSNQQYQFQFSINLAATLPNGAIALNQGSLSGTDTTNKVWTGNSDDPYINGVALLGSTIPLPDSTPITVNSPVALSKANTQTTATIGQQFRYRITVPATPANVPLYDVRILDNLGASAANLNFVSATVVSGGAWTLTNTGTATNVVLQDLNTGIDIPAGGQAVIDVTVQMANTATNKNGLTFANTASYTYDKVNGDITTQGAGGAATTANMTVVEPALTIAKAVSYASPAGKLSTAAAVTGDVLQYTITVTNNGTSTAYDTSVTDVLPFNLSLVAGSETAVINGTPVTGFVQTPTVLANGSLVWGAQNGDPNLIVPVGGTLVLAFQAGVLQANGTPITNISYADWTSLAGAVAGERTGTGCPIVTAPNTYCSGPATATVNSIDPTALAKAVASDTWAGQPTGTLRVGDLVTYSITATLLEGTTQNVVIADTLPANMVFDHVVSVNGVATSPYGSVAPFTYASFTGPVISNGGATSTWSFGNVYNTPDNNLANNNFVIQYAARVVNTIAPLPAAQVLTNSATLNYAINGVAGTAKTASAPINVFQPVLSVTKTAVPAGGGTVLVPGELVAYTVTITNSGNAPAYNPVLQDILPLGMRGTSPVTASISLVVGGIPTPLAVLQPTYSGATGVATWNLATATPNQYLIPPGAQLVVSYNAWADATLGAGMILSNQAQVTHYYSLDSSDPNAAFRKDYGATGVATVQLTTASATALSKAATVTTAAVGQPFTYQITVPATPQATWLYNVSVLDNISLAATGVSLNYLGSSAALKSGTKSWASLTNGGTATSLILQDTTTGGLNIPPGDQLIVTVTVVLANDTANNTAGKQFTNTANYTYNSVANNNATQANGGPGASGAVTIAWPNLTLVKSGPATMLDGVPATFTLNAQNTGASTAWNPVLSDILPTGATGGMCGTPPSNVTARVYQADGVTAVSGPLVNGTDFTVSWAAAPACTLTLNMLTAAAAVPPTDRLIVTYSAQLDPGTASGLALTNIAGATQWLSANPAAPGATGNVHTFINTLTNGTPGVLDFQDAFTTTTAAPVLTFTKTVFDMTTGQSGANAKPGDTLQYTLTIQNISAVPANNFSLTDTLDALNNPAMFVPGTLALVSVPAGASTALTSPTGGAKGTGIVSISGLNAGASGSANATAVIKFNAKLAPAINNGTVVLNQGQITGGNIALQLSTDPAVAGVNQPTRALIASAPAWRVQKTVQDVTSGTSVVMAGDVLQYTITVKNIGTENATGVTLTDAIPNYTAYVAGSTRLNGAVVADPVAGVSALQNGMPINSPLNATPGAMPADATATLANVATITFQVKINPATLNGTIVSNQGFVNGSGAASGPFAAAPSDDPATAALNDPTRVIVGNLPLLYATKAVALVVDLNNNGVIDAGDTVRYTITVSNSGSATATGVKLTDATPLNTAYVANTTFLNGAGVGQPDGGVPPLAAGVSINSPGAAAGSIAPGAQAVVTFNAQVNAAVAGGTVISNQGSVASAQLPGLLTDADGNPANGYQPTTFVVGSAQQVAITKQVSVVGGGAALPGSQLNYVVQVTNTGTVAATNVVITDDLSVAPLASQVSYVAGSATLNGSTAGVSVTGSVITANYGTTYGSLAPGATATLSFKVTIAGGLVTGTQITNNGQAAWNTPALTATGSASISVGGIPGAAILSGQLWYDTNYNYLVDAGEQPLAGWSVGVYRNNTLLGTVLADANGLYSIPGLAPTTTAADQYTLKFLAPGATATTAKLGLGYSIFTNGEQQISGISAPSGGVIPNLDLPINPDGQVYNSIMRMPVAGATLTVLKTGSTVPVAAACFNDPAQQGQVTISSGYYKFDLNFSDPSCPSGASYLIQVTPPASYVPGMSKVIPPSTSAATAAFSVPTCPGSPTDAIPATTLECEAAASPFAPGLNVPPSTAGTTYYLNLVLDNTSNPGHSQLFDNHIPLDPQLGSAVMITKTAAKQNVSKGDLVPYTITVNNTMAANLTSMAVVDTFPPGFKYVTGSARLDGLPVTPVFNAATRQLTWSSLTLAPNTKHAIQLMLVVGAGVAEGKYVNRAQVFDTLTGGAASPVAEATVRVVADPTLDCSDVIGKVFDDANLNGHQDEGEKGLPGVRIAAVNGLIVTTDKFGRFHLTCAVVPDPDRGSNFILKIDDRSLPSGYRLTTENPLVLRVTRGKMAKFNFGAAIHRVLKMDMFDGVFEPGTTQLRVQWKPRIDQLVGELKKAPSVLRLTYNAETEDAGLVSDRLKALKGAIVAAWKKEKRDYDLTIETEVFWRTGAPPEGGAQQAPEPDAGASPAGGAVAPATKGGE